MSKLRCISVFSLIVLTLAAGSFRTTRGQSSIQTTAAAADAKSDRSSLEVQFHLLVASNDPGDKGAMQQSLESVVRQLKPSLPFTNYRVVASFANRVKSGGTLESKGVLSSDIFTPGSNPSSSGGSIGFYEYTLMQVKLVPDGSNQFIEIPRFRFSLRLPVGTSMTQAEGTKPPTPVVNYDLAGMSTELYLRDGTPTVVGTMTTSKPNQLLVLVISVKQIP